MTDATRPNPLEFEQNHQSASPSSPGSNPNRRKRSVNHQMPLPHRSARPLSPAPTASNLQSRSPIRAKAIEYPTRSLGLHLLPPPSSLSKRFLLQKTRAAAQNQSETEPRKAETPPRPTKKPPRPLHTPAGSAPKRPSRSRPSGHGPAALPKPPSGAARPLEWWDFPTLPPVWPPGAGVKAGVVRGFGFPRKTKVAHTARNLTPRCFHSGPLAACAVAGAGLLRHTAHLLSQATRVQRISISGHV